MLPETASPPRWRFLPSPTTFARTPARRPRRMSKQPVYKRVLLKLSGEALMGRRDYGLDNDIVNAIATDIGDVAPWACRSAS